VKAPLLLLCHRIPYPPRKGDKVRTYHLLRLLARRYAVHLGTFVDDPDDWRHVEALGEHCADLLVRPLRPLGARARSLRGLLAGSPLTVPYFADARLRAWVEERLASRRFTRVVVVCSSMAQYVEGHLGARLRSVLDLIDVDSEKWRDYAGRRRWPMRAVYAREGRTLLAYERALAARFDATVLVSAEEAALLRRLSPECAGRIEHVRNGVDAGYFRPDRACPNPYPPGTRALVFTGAMDYWANADAVRWFAEQAFPAVRARVPEAAFWVVGARPTREVRALARRPGVEVTGAVDDVRPYLAHAAASVAPLRLARGVQNKVLEAMAMARPVIATPEALEGLGAWPRSAVREAASPGALAEAALAVLAEGPAACPEARAFVREHFDWDANLGRLCELLEGEAPAAAPAAACA